MEKLLFANERVKEFEIKGKIQGEDVKGKFKAKYPSVLDTLEIQKINSNLLKGANPNTLANITYDTAYMMAFLEVLLLEKPEWFDYSVIDNVDIIFDTYKEVYDFVESFRSGDGDDRHSDNSNEAVAKETVEDK